MNLIVDSIMGSGKTTWAIRYMNSFPQRKFIYVTPFLDEDKRIRELCPSLRFVEPDGTFSKLSDIRKLVKEGKNIATTHALLSRWIPTAKDRELLYQQGYTLILDETIEVIVPIDNLNKTDVEVLKNGMIQVNEITGQACWIAEDFPQRYRDVQKLAKEGRLYLCRNSQLFDVMPAGILKAMPNMIVLTFLFEASHLYHFMKIHKIPWKKAYIRNGALIFGDADLCSKKECLAGLLAVYEGKLNNVGDEETALSASFWKSNVNIEKQKVVLRHARSFLESLHQAKSGQSMWSVFLGKNRTKTRTVKNYATSFVPFNEKATNKYRKRYYLAYLVNVFENPMIAGWFGDRGSALDSDLYALSVMLQWIWRSALRDGNPVYLYLPSRRMRRILNKWLTT